MEKRLKTIGGYNLIEFEQRVNEFLAKLRHFKIIDVKYVNDTTENRYLAFIIYQI